MTLTKEESLAVLKAIKTRRSIRKYKSTPVPQELIDQVIEAGTYAASGKSQQPWLVIQVTDAETKDRIRRSNPFLWVRAKMPILSMAHPFTLSYWQSVVIPTTYMTAH